MTDYTANNKDPVEKSKLEKPEVEKIIEGDVEIKKKGILHKFRDTFFGGDVHTTTRYVLGDVLLPAARNMVVDLTTRGIERMVYGENNPRRSSTSFSGRTQYNSPVIRRADPSGMISAPAPRAPQRRQSSADDIILASRGEAEQVLEAMNTIAEQYEVASLADLYNLLGLQHQHTDNKWGWFNLTHAEVVQVREGWLLNLPPMQAL